MEAVQVGWLEFNVRFQHKYSYIRDEAVHVTPLRRTIVSSMSSP